MKNYLIYDSKICDHILKMDHHTLNEAIYNHDLDTIEKCLEAGVCITTQSVRRFQSKMLYFNCKFKSASKRECHVKIFEHILLKNYFDVITNDINFMTGCVQNYDKYYIQSIITAGFNGNHTQSVKIFKNIIRRSYKNKHDDNLIILLENGFCRHIQPLLIYCITKCNEPYLALFTKMGGANFYSVLHDLHTNVLSQSLFCQYRWPNINFVLRHMYEMTMLREPICKYFLIKSVHCDMIIEIPILIFQCYMLLDYEYTDNIRRKISESKSICFKRDKYGRHVQ